MKTLLLAVFSSVSLATAATIVTVRGAANVYPTEMRRVYERPVFTVGKGEIVEVLQWGKPLTKIRNRKGRQGWVEIAKLDSTKRPPILNLVIDSEEVATPASPSGSVSPTPSNDSGRVK